MPVERGKGHGQERGAGRPEYQPAPYYLAATFTTREEAEQPYQRSQKLIYTPTHDLDLSAYRFERQLRDPNQPALARPWYVVVLGERPPEPIDQQLLEILGGGEITSLPLETVVTLSKRRAQESKKGSWVEGHYAEGVIIPEASIHVQRRNPKKEKGKRKMQKDSRRRNRGR
jgi:hypothetical protein